jgi:hypothetical protein
MTDEVPTDSTPFSAIPRNCVTRDERERVIAPQATLRGASSRTAGVLSHCVAALMHPKGAAAPKLRICPSSPFVDDPTRFRVS